MTNDDKLCLTFGQLIGAAFALVCVVAAATFAITALATQSHVAALQLQASQLDSRVRQLEGQLGLNAVAPAAAASSDGPPAVEFVKPTADGRVGPFADVEFVLKGHISEGQRPYVLVRDTLGQYWSWGAALSGRVPRVQFGLATDHGQPFELGVLVTDVEVPGGKPLLTRPKGVLYKSITVVRE